MDFAKTSWQVRREGINLNTIDKWVEKIPEAGCWIWLGSLNKFGYGTARGTLAHRFVFKMHGNEIASGLDVMHKCHNRACVNPAHMLTGTRKQNIKMSVDAGRWNNELRSKNQSEVIKRNSKNGFIVGRRATFSDDEIKEIRTNCTTPEIKKEYANKYKISYQAINQIVKFRSYRYVL